MTTGIDRVAEAVRAFAEGEIVVVTDDDDRENEADLILAAVHATPEKIALVIRHTSGILCTPLPQAEARRLQLWPMVTDNDVPLSTAFTVSVVGRGGQRLLQWCNGRVTRAWRTLPGFKKGCSSLFV